MKYALIKVNLTTGKRGVMNNAYTDNELALKHAEQLNQDKQANTNSYYVGRSGELGFTHVVEEVQ